MPKHTAASGQGLRLGDDGPRACGLCSAMAMTSMRLNAAWVPARGGNAAAEAMLPPMPVPARTAWLLGHVAAWRWPEGLRQWLGMCIACFAQMLAAAHVHMCMAQLHVSSSQPCPGDWHGAWQSTFHIRRIPAMPRLY